MSFSDFVAGKGLTILGNVSQIADATVAGKALLLAATNAAQLSLVSNNLIYTQDSTVYIAGNLAAGAMSATDLLKVSTANASMSIRLTNSSAAANLKVSDLFVDNAGSLALRFLSDDATTASPFLTVTRAASGAPNTMTLTSVATRITGSLNVAGAASLSTLAVSAGTTLSSLAVSGAASFAAAVTVPTVAVTDNSTSAANTGWVNSALQSFGGQTPIGGVIYFIGAASTIPANWHILDGSTVAINGTSVKLPDTRGKFSMASLDGTYANLSTGGSFTQTPNIGDTTLTIDQIPLHGHSVTDPGHLHGITDNGHLHGISDPGHSHNMPVNTAGNLGYGSAACRNDGNGVFQGAVMINANAIGTYGATTGVAVYSATTGVKVQNATTGITLQNTGGGKSHKHTADPISTLPTYVAMYQIVRMY